MAEAIRGRSALATVLEDRVPRGGNGAGISVRECHPLTIVQIAMLPGIRGDRRPVEQVLGAPLPDIQRSNVASGLSVLWTGAEQWWAVGNLERGPELLQALEAAAAGAFAILDLSQSRTVLRVSGKSARRVLAKGCGVDFHLRCFPAGMSVATGLARLSAVIHAADPTSFDIYVYRSFGRELLDWLIEASAEYGLSLEAPHP